MGGMKLHKYLRAIGFSQFDTREKIRKLLKASIISSDYQNFITNGEDTMLANYRKEFFPGCGISVCGELDENNNFSYDYYYPYLTSSIISSYEDISIERHYDREAYGGICDDIRVGVTLIFYLENMIDYLKFKNSGRLPIKETSLCLSGLSVEGTIMMPISKNKKQREDSIRKTNNRYRLIQAARRGDEKAIESLTLDDMDTYSTISKKIHKEDLFSIVDSYFMPYGMECDQYSILGEILECKEEENKLTKEKIYKILLNCNELILEICINKEDLYGQPMVGRRFKGQIWLQGYINFP